MLLAAAECATLAAPGPRSLHPPPMTVFDDAVSLTEQPDGSWLGRTSAAYANMVGPFGGITAAAMLNAVMSHRERAGEPVALTVNFAAPVAEGAYQIHARNARSNRSTQHWILELLQEGGVVATGTSVLALRRDTWSAPEAAMPANPPRPESLPRAPLEGRPPWVHRYDMRFVSGGLPALDGREQPNSGSCLWIRDDPPRPLDFLSLAAICDNFLPRIYVRRRRRTPVGTVSMTAYFHADGPMLAAQADRFVLGVARALSFRNGFFDQSAEVWSDAGELLASTHQIVYFRE
jgi:acyl-CoA thioesterase